MIVIIIAKPTERGEGAAAAAKTQRSPPSLPLLSSPFFLPYGVGQAVAALQGKINVDKLDRFTCPHATQTTIPQLGRRVGFSSTLD